MIDAGHGEFGNLGNKSARCEREAAFTLRTQDAVLAHLRAQPGLELRAGRPTAAVRSYEDRIDEMEHWPADAVLSLHSDSRATKEERHHDPTTGCPSAEGSDGFSVLWSDEGEASLVERRHGLARAVAQELLAAGFPAYDGADYPGLYASDEAVPGVFVDRHAPGKRIKMLRRPTVPVVIVETHHALDGREVARWNEAETLDAFSGALYAALLTWAGPVAPTSSSSPASPR